MIEAPHEPVPQEAFDEAFTLLLQSLEEQGPRGLVVACSGGPDSMALVHLAQGWAASRAVSVFPVIVDHGLRDEAAEEAAEVAQTVSSLGLSPTVLTHRGKRPKRNIQAQARVIRYGLIRDWMADQGLTHLLLGHHLEDQAETVLLRLARGSGVDGLSAMAPVSQMDGITLLRPLLGFSKEALMAVVQARGIPFVQDPTNRNTQHARVRMRNAATLLAAEGLTSERLAATAGRMARARIALEHARDAFLNVHALGHSAGFATFSPGAFSDLPEEVGLRVLAQLCRTVGGRTYSPREERLVALHRAVTDRRLAAGRTLAGCRVLPWRDSVLVCRESAGVQDPVEATAGAIWDNRFLCLTSATGRPVSQSSALMIGKLGQAGIQSVHKSHLSNALDHLPGAARGSLPAIWRGEELLHVPALEMTSSEVSPVALQFRAGGVPW